MQLFPPLAVTTTDTVITRICSSHRLLCNRFPLQLRAAHYEVYDIFFSLSAGERMQLISCDRELARERELRRQVTFAEALFEMENNTYIRGVLISHCRKLLHYSKVMLAFNCRGSDPIPHDQIEATGML